MKLSLPENKKSVDFPKQFTFLTETLLALTPSVMF